MTARRFVPSLILMVVAVCVACALHRPAGIRGGDPGGPIVIIKPTPEPSFSVAQLALGAIAPSVVEQCSKVGPCWYVGWFDSDHWGNLPDWVGGGVKENPAKLPYYLNHVAPVAYIKIRWNDAQKPDTPVYAVCLTLDAGVLEISGYPQDVPAWTLNGETPKWVLRPRDELPQQFLTAIKQIGTKDSKTDEHCTPVDLSQVNEVRIQYWQ